MKTLILITLSILNLYFLNAQVINDFYSLTSEGKLPDHFTTLSIEKYYEQSSQIDRSESRFDKKRKKEFYQQSNYWLDQLILSGRVTFGDPVTDYLNDVADVLLEKYPKVRKEIKIYTSKSPVANAFSTDQGIILINTGLIGRVNSEAELAYILAHEIIHYMEKHSINQHIEKQKIIYNKGRLNKSDISDKILNINSMSKENEFEADELAYTKIYKNTKYSINELESVFKLLLMSEASFAEIPFEKDFLENKYYIFPDDYFLDSIPAFDIKELEELDEEDDDELRSSTHPSTKKRKHAILRLKIKDIDTGRSKYIVSEERFNKIKTLSQFESIRQFMISKQYIDAIYNSYVLLKEYPNNKFLETTIGSAIYLISHYKTQKQSEILSFEYISQSAEIKQVQHFFEEINETEANVLAINYLTGLRKKHGESKFIDAMLDDLFDDLCIVNKARYKEFFKKEELDRDISLNDPNKEDNELYYLNAFTEHMDDSFFKEKFKYWDDKRKENKENEDKLENMSLRARNKIEKSKNKEKYRKLKKEDYYGKSLDIKKFMVIDPVYIKISNRKGGHIDLEQSELKKLRYKDRIEYCIRKGDFDSNVKIIDSKSFSTSDVVDFNSLSLLNDWLNERMRHDIDFDYVPYSCYYIGDVVKNYQTNHYLWTGVFSERIKKPVGYAIAGSVFLTYGLTLPAVVLWACIPDFRTYYYSFLFDIETGERMLVEFEDYKGSDKSGDFVYSSVYDTFNQISRDK